MDDDAAIRRHVAAVNRHDLDEVVRSYAEDAVLERPDATHVGHDAIRAYFATVPERLGPGRVEVLDVRHDLGELRVRWRVNGGPADGTSGTDTFQIEDSLIRRQRVALDGPDL